MEDNKPTFGSLFAGIGGMDLGLERAGFECKWQVEIDKYATKVLEKNWPEVARHKDVKTFPPEDDSESKTIPWKVDLIAGGFPCQDISVAGRGEGLSGKRSGLFHEVIRIAYLLQPRWLVLENVSALLVRGFGTVARRLAQVGYDAEWHCIPAASVGAPHIRDRIFIIGTLADTNGNASTNAEGAAFIHRVTLDKRRRAKASDRSTASGNWSGNVSDANGKGPQGLWKTRSVEPICTQESIGVYRSEVGESQWRIEPRMGRMANGIPNRAHRLRGLGNAVVPQVAEYIGRQIIKDYQIH